MNFIVSFQKLATRMSRCGGMTSGSNSRLREDVVKSGKVLQSFQSGPCKQFRGYCRVQRWSLPGQSGVGGEIGFGQEECLQCGCQPRESVGWDWCRTYRAELVSLVVVRMSSVLSIAQGC